MKIRLFIFACAFITALQARCELKLNSLPDARATIYLDFDGEQVWTPLWNNGNVLNCAAPALSNTQITEIFNRVAEDYRPFDVNVTTDVSVYYAAPADQRIRVIITPTSSWFAGVGGIAFVGSFTWGDDTPCFAFSDRLSNNTKMIAECCAHESGHTLGLSHQSKYDGSCALTATYNDGAGTGEAAWAPIMGNSYARNMSGWNNGPTPYGCHNVQDNLSIITSMNGFGYRPDDYSNAANENSLLINATNIDLSGIINTNTDKDAFRVVLQYPSNFHLEAKPFSVSDNNEGADLDIRLNIYDALGNLVSSYNPANTMSVTVDTVLSAGAYYIVVDGTGNNYASDYGSLGSYTLKGIAGALPVCRVNLNGNVNRRQHVLNWSLECFESIRSIEVEQSADGNNFQSVGFANLPLTNYAATPAAAGKVYYRLKITSSSDRVAYSNVVLLKVPEQGESLFVVASLVHSDIELRAGSNYSYSIADMNGKTIGKGSGQAGFNRIALHGQPNGMYVLLLSTTGQRSSYRLVKQ